LAADEVDLALVYRPAMWPSLRVIASIPQRLVVIVRSDHPLAVKETVRLSECADYAAAAFAELMLSSMQKTPAGQGPLEGSGS
jgi:DNA-binding transcriptional LysR family regulator